VRSRRFASAMRWFRGGAILLAFTALLVAPEVLNLFWVRVLSNVFLFAAVAQAFNLIAGYTGYPAFGNVVFFGIGAYGTAIAMTRYGASFALALLVGIGLCLVFVAVFGPPLLRLRGHYFAIATIGLNEAIHALATNLEITGAGMGLSVPLPPWEPRPTALFFYYLLLGLMALGFALTAWFAASRVGHACRAIRDNEGKAEALGLHTTAYKCGAWALSAVLTGAAGGIYVYWFSYIEPPAVFDLTIAVKAFVMFLLGGAGTLLGPIIGAFAVELTATLAWSHLLDFHTGLMGLIIMLVVLLMPRGLVPFVASRWQVLRRLVGIQTTCVDERGARDSKAAP